MELLPIIVCITWPATALFSHHDLFGEPHDLKVKENPKNFSFTRSTSISQKQLIYKEHST